MASLERQTALIDELQKELNSVLEHLGRMFAALNANPKVPPITQKEQLKRDIPAATKRFHLSLDELESQLHDARLTLRRDLAVARERDSLQAQSKAPGRPADNSAVEGNKSLTDSEMLTEPTKQLDAASEQNAGEIKPDADQDIKMEDSDSVKGPSDVGEHQATPESTKMESETKHDGTPDIKATDASTDSHVLSAADDQNSAGPVTEQPELSIDTTTQIGDSASKVEGVKAEEEAEPETANTENNTADLDSLFNGPLSATGDNNEFSFDQAHEGDIDFGSLGGDNDNISSLLPGLQDYANPQPDATAGGTDFDSMFDMNNTGNDDINNAAGSAGDQEAFNFEEFMNANHFDANGNITSIEGGGTSNDSESQQQFDFDALFE